ncbi:putative protein BRICK1 [Globodera pallida]|uniref:Protein BRICK1 n=1 Tax=Globodera pallida TaxID=36090 RepID=A0A183BHL4_GLOPA|nr:putative protein BRICK1 [Globodera pallida]
MSIQRQLKEDWDNREFISVLSDNVRQISDFLAHFELTCKSKLANLNDSITSMERKVEFLESMVTRGETLN